MLGQTSDIPVGIVSLFISLGLYFLPTIVALSRRGPNSGSVTLINLLLGWTVIGWLVALAMAVKPKHPQLPDLPRPPRGAFPRSDHGRKPGLAQSREPEASEIEVNPTLPEGEIQASTRATSSAATPPPPAWTVASPVDHEQDPIDYAADLLFEAHARGVIDAATRARLERLLDERRPRAQVSPRVGVAPPPRPEAQVPVWGSGAAPAPEPVSSGLPLAPPPAFVAEAPPSRTRSWLERTRALVVSDLAVHGLVYLGVLLLFVGTLGFLLFSFQSIQVGLRPVAEFALPGALLASAWFLRRRGAPFVATALGLLGGMLLPMFAFASFVDGVSFPPELHGPTLVAALIATSAAIGLGYAAYSVREPEASLRYLVAPMAWLAAWAAGFLLVWRPGEEIDLSSWSAGQFAITTAAVCITVVVARLLPRGRFSGPTIVAALPGLAGAYVLTLVLAGSEGWPPIPIAIAGVSALLTIELEAERLGRDASSILQAALLGITSIAVGNSLGAGWGGVVAAAGFLGLLEWHVRRWAETPALWADSAGVLVGLGFAFVEPWPATVAFGGASAWAHARRLRPPPIPNAALVLDLAAALLPVGFAIGLVWALPDGVAIVSIAAAVTAGSVAVRIVRPDDRFYLSWIPAAAGLVALGTVFPPLPEGQAAAAAALSGVALAVVPEIPAARLWSAAPVFAWAAWLAMQGAGLSDPQRSITWSLAGVALVAVGSIVRSPLGGHAAAVGMIAGLGGLASSSDDQSRTIGLAAWTAAWLLTVAMGEIRARGLAPLLVRGAVRTGWSWLKRIAIVVPPIVLLASAPLLVADLCERSGITVGRRSWTGVAMSITAVVYGLIARSLARRLPLASVAAIAAFVVAAIGISISAPDPWPSIISVVALIGVTFSVGPALRRPVMTWTGWAASGVLAVLVTERAGIRSDDISVVIAAWGVVLLVGGLVVDDRRAGRRGAGEGIRTPWLWPPVAVGALGLPVGLALVFPQGPDVYGPWSIAASGVYLGVALLLRAGAVTVVSWALLTTGVAALIPWSAIARPWLFVPWGAALALVGVALGFGKARRQHWLRWDLPPLIVAHAVAAVGLVRSLDVGWVPATWGGFGAVAVALAAIERSVVWGIAGVILLDVAAGAAGPGWLSLALAISSCVAVAAAIRLVPPVRWAVQATGAALAAGAWWQLTVWSEWSTGTAALATAAAASLLVLGAGAWVRWGRSSLDWAVSMGGLGLAGGIAAIAVSVAPPAPGLDRVEIAWVLASVTGSWALALGVSARRFGSLDLREGSAALAVATAVVLAVGYEVEVGPAVAASAAAGLVATVGAVLLWRVRSGSPWLRPLGIVAGASDVAGAVLAIIATERRDLLIAMLLVSSVESAAAGVMMRRAWLLGLAPVLACTAWLLFAADVLRGEVQWFTVPIGVALLVVLAVARWAGRGGGEDPGAPAMLILEFIGMALVVGASLVQIVVVGPVHGLVAIAGGAGIAIWGGMTRVRRRVFFGAATVVLSLILMVAGPVARLVPDDSTAVWIVLLAAGAVLVVIATMIERFRSGIARLIGRVETLMEGWE